MKVTTRRLLEEQIAAVVVLGKSEKNDAMWHVPHPCIICIQKSKIKEILSYCS